MKKVIDMIGISEHIEQVVAEKLQDKTVTMEEIKSLIKQAVDSYAADLYSNMKTTEEQKYKLIEFDVQLGNLTMMVKAL